jgi:hypothetical protein
VSFRMPVMNITIPWLTIDGNDNDNNSVDNILRSTPRRREG